VIYYFFISTVCLAPSDGKPSFYDRAPLLVISPNAHRGIQTDPITGEELQVKFLTDSGENSLKY